MANDTRRKNPLKWEGNYVSQTPVWPTEPDIAVIKNLAKQHLSAEIAGTIEAYKLEITHFAYGAFNKLYLVSYSGHEAKYLFRVTSPVIPFFKTESEVATLAYLRTNTSIPVPRAIAWNSSSDNDLGFEWILMNKVAGVELRSVWRQISWQRKLELVDEVAGFVHQLQARPFDALGSLYFKSALTAHQSEDNTATEALFEEQPQESGLEGPVKFVEIKGNMAATSATTGTLQSGIDTTNGDGNNAQSIPKEAAKNKDQEPAPQSPESTVEEQFVVGPLFSWVYWLGARLYLPGHRGPYKNSYEWLKALIEMQRTWVKAGRVDDDSDYGSDFEEEAPEIKKACQQYLDILPSICPENDKTPPSLYHHDLNSANILVDPETFAITGIVDWETINILPRWRATDYPKFLKSEDPASNIEPPIPSYENGQTVETDTRDQWDNWILRGRYDEAMKRLSDDYESTMSPEPRKTQREFEEMVGNLSDYINAAQYWLEKNKAGIEHNKKMQEENAADGDKNEIGRDLEQATPSNEASLVGEVPRPKSELAPEEDTKAHIPTLPGVLPISAITVPEDVASTHLEALKLEEPALSNIPKAGLAESVCAKGGNSNPQKGEMTQEPVIEKKSEDIEAKAPAVPTVPEFDLRSCAPAG
ncbi:hypothetical protein G7Y79_00020g049030 [Physcia stellaris]|nr:hypothetical protein G7Y79_00020g049030 [Physcia stellaris]